MLTHARARKRGLPATSRRLASTGNGRMDAGGKETIFLPAQKLFPDSAMNGRAGTEVHANGVVRASRFLLLFPAPLAAKSRSVVGGEWSEGSKMP